MLSFDEKGNKVWERELDIYGNVRKGDNHFIPFLYQGQYYDEETGLAYNRFRYYNPETGGYISQDPIGLLSGEPNFYAYAPDVNSWIDPFGLAWGPLNWSGMGHHLLPRSVAGKLGIQNLSTTKAFAWYPNKPSDFPDIHLEMHQKLKGEGIPWRGGNFEGTLDDFMKKARKAYEGYDMKGMLKFKGANGRIIKTNLTPNEALDTMENMIKKGKIPCK
ncbi:RHS repeat domain-containing protein [Tenacibaculum ovolyticum]|uniref:RHS repeat domain-containing protein n=1 Tax=Tenacibaculum ovolyticum TaxID=104270 RepID=UPI0009D6B51F|nr:RHS repeat-associated core domain-containing protein [Tenacibaculum ovolyticum]